MLGGWNLKDMPIIVENPKSNGEDLGAGDMDDSRWLKLVKVALQEQGFYPQVIIDQMKSNRQAYNAEMSGKPKLKWDLSNLGRELKVTDNSRPEEVFSNDECFIKDVNFLLTLFTFNNNDTASKGKNKEINPVIEMLKKKYKICDEAKDLNPTVITLPRIAKAFPVATVKLFHNNLAVETVPYEAFPGDIKPKTHAITCPLLPFLYPLTTRTVSQTQSSTGVTQSGQLAIQQSYTTQPQQNRTIIKKGDNLHSVMLWAAIKHDDIIHREDQQYTSLIEILRCYRAALQSNAVSEATRISLLEEFGLVLRSPETEAPLLTREAAELGINCYSALDQLRTHDVHHALMMEVAAEGRLNLIAKAL